MLKVIKNIAVSLFLLFAGNSLFSQNDFYEFGDVHEVKIYFYDDNWKTRLDSLFGSGDDESRILADIVIDGNTYEACGIRYKGFSSWNLNEIKNPFNIKLDYTYKRQNHLGYKKIKLSNVIYDPSFVREALAYHIAGKYFPASSANFANVYINDTLIGIYSNVESVDDCFTEKYFGASSNPLIKGSPESLQYPFGQNANLAHTHGNDSSGYMPYYSLESDYGYTDLYNFIDVLNNDTANIASVLNIDRALWMHAFNYTILNLDSYIAYAQNYYLYLDDLGAFNTIIWDLNMSFGSFRHSDGSLNFQGLSIDQIINLDPLQHLSFSISPRPLMKNLFQNARYRKMYLAHIRTILEQNILNGEYLESAEDLQSKIESSVLADTNKFYSNDDFYNNIYSEVGESTELYPGLKDLMEARSEYLISYAGIYGNPEFSQYLCSNEFIVDGDAISLTVNVTNADSVFMYYRFNTNQRFLSCPLFDNGNFVDSIANDNYYSTSLIANGNVFQFYFWAENDSSGAFYPSQAANSFFEIDYVGNNDVLINEVMKTNGNYSNNLTSVDWVELYNPHDRFVKLSNYKLRYGNTFAYIDDTVIMPFGHFVFYPLDILLDSDDCSSTEREITVFSNADIIIDTLQIPYCNSVYSFGRYPDGSVLSRLLEPSRGQTNKIDSPQEYLISCYPNPVMDELKIDFSSGNVIEKLSVFNQSGECVFSMGSKEISDLSNTQNTTFSLNIDTSLWTPGLYFVSIVDSNEKFSAKFVKLK